MVVAFTVAALLGSQSLVQLAEQQPYGPKRSVVVTLAHALDRVSHALSLDRPVAAANGWLGKAPQERIDVEAFLVEQAEAPPPVPSTIPLDINPATGQRYVSAAEPLRVLLAGDSMMRELGTSLIAHAPGDVTDTTLDFRVSTGLSRPDFFDWPSHLALELDRSRPEAVVLLFGANDYQDVAVDGRVLDAGSPDWLGEYRHRVAVVMDLLQRPGTTVTWVTLPPMRSGEFSAAMEQLNVIYRQEAATRDWVHVVEMAAAVAGPDGGYTAYLPGGGGVEELVRQEDGVHLSRAGADRAAAVVWADVQDRWLIDGS